MQKTLLPFLLTILCLVCVYACAQVETETNNDDGKSDASNNRRAKFTDNGAAKSAASNNRRAKLTDNGTAKGATSNNRRARLLDRITDASLQKALNYYKVPKKQLAPDDFDQIVECNDCAIVIDGHLLFSPFAFQIRNERLYVNGVQFQPAPRKFSYVFQLMEKRKQSPFLSNGEKRRSFDECREINLGVFRFIQKTIKTHKPHEAERLIQKHIEKAGHEFRRVTVHGPRYYEVAYRPRGCSLAPGGTREAKESPFSNSRMSDLMHSALPEKPNPQVKEKGRLVSLITDGYVLVPNRRNGFVQMRIDKAVEIGNILSSKGTPREQIQSIMSISFGMTVDQALALVANGDNFCDTLRKEGMGN